MESNCFSERIIWLGNGLHVFKSLAPVSDSPGTGKGTALLTFCAGGEGLCHFKKFLHKIRRRESLQICLHGVERLYQRYKNRKQDYLGSRWNLGLKVLLLREKLRRLGRHAIQTKSKHGHKWGHNRVFPPGLSQKSSSKMYTNTCKFF